MLHSHIYCVCGGTDSILSRCEVSGGSISNPATCGRQTTPNSSQDSNSILQGFRWSQKIAIWDVEQIVYISNAWHGSDTKMRKHHVNSHMALRCMWHSCDTRQHPSVLTLAACTGLCRWWHARCGSNTVTLGNKTVLKKLVYTDLITGRHL